MRILRLVIFVSIVVGCTTKLEAQEDWGGKLGINIQFGTHIQRLGLMYQLYYFNDHFSYSHASYLRWNKKALGPKGSYFEAKIQFGIQGQWISSHSQKHLMNDFSNMAPYLNSFGYNLYLYLDQKEMSQTTGALFGNASEFSWAIENDAFGLNQVDDKYRTGGFYVGFQIDSLLLGVQSTLWTANSSKSAKVSDPAYPGRFGYRDISGLKYGENSHGILAINAQYKTDLDQTLRADFGIDSESIRHALQNKMIHDGLSKRLVNSESAHYPMLQNDGSMFLFKEGQKRKKPKPYFQFGSNDAVFY